MNEEITNQIFDTMDIVLTFEQLKELFGIGNDKALSLVNRTDFPSFRIGKKHIIPRRELIEWIGKQGLSKSQICFASGLIEKNWHKTNRLLEKAMKDKKILFTLEELAEMLEIDLEEAVELFHTKDFPRFKIGSKSYIPLHEFIKWLQKNAESKKTLCPKSELSEFLKNIDNKALRSV